MHLTIIRRNGDLVATVSCPTAEDADATRQGLVADYCRLGWDLVTWQDDHVTLRRFAHTDEIYTITV